MKIRRNFNYRKIVYGELPGDRIGIRRKDGEYVHVAWLGYIDLAFAKKLITAKPVKIEAHAYTCDELGVGYNWVDLPKDSHLQGCFTSRGVYCVISLGKPIIIPANAKGCHHGVKNI